MARGLTQEQFAELSGISYKYYQAVEAGRKRDLRLSTVVRLADANGLTVWELFHPSKPIQMGKSSPRKRSSNRKTGA